MNKQAKNLLIVGTVGLGVVYVGNKMLKTDKCLCEQHRLYKNRKMVEKFVAKHTGNNSKLVAAVQKLSDNQILDLISMIKQIKQMQSKVYVEGLSVKDITRKIINQVASYL